jgi:hypothetical protein
MIMIVMYRQLENIQHLHLELFEYLVDQICY